MVAARIVTDSHGPFADTRLSNAGSEKGVKAGNPVMSENGLVGRVIGVTNGASRVLLLTDIASRTPVMIDRTNARAILTGDGGPNPRLDYLRGRDPIREGDRLLTSGDGGVLPRGLPVGTAVKGLDGRWRVVLASDKAPIDFVRILLFEDFTQVVNQKELSQTPAPPPTPGPGGATVKPDAAVDAAAAVPSKAPAAADAASPTAKPPIAKPKGPEAAAPAKPAAAKPPPAKPAVDKTTGATATAAKPDGTAKPKPKPPPKPPPKPAADGPHP
jgi:rod shape-determining protein MreC